MAWMVLLKNAATFFTNILMYLKPTDLVPDISHSQLEAQVAYKLYLQQTKTVIISAKLV